MNRHIHQWIARFCSKARVLSAESGNALVETALVLGIFGVPLFYGTSDLAVWTSSTIEIDNAAHAGALFGMQDSSASYAGNSAGIQAAAQSEAGSFGTSLTTTSTKLYACASSQDTQYPTLDSTPSCSGTGDYKVEFIQVVASAPLTLPFHCCGMPQPLTLTSTSEMQVVGSPL
jgi:Flp pilus assembly protein TadG